jgi:hypothetical protein
MKGARICTLRKTIIKLAKLQYLFAGDKDPYSVYSYQILSDNLAELCGTCCAPGLLKDVEWMNGHPNWHDVCTLWHYVVFPTLASRRPDPYGVIVPRGVRKLKSPAHTGCREHCRKWEFYPAGYKKAHPVAQVSRDRH